MNVKVNQANLGRVAIHIGLAAAGAAVAALGLDLSHSSNPEVVAVAGMLMGALGSLIRQEQAVNDSGGQVDPLGTLRTLAANRAAEEAAIAEIAGAFGYSKATMTLGRPLGVDVETTATAPTTPAEPPAGTPLTAEERAANGLPALTLVPPSTPDLEPPEAVPTS